MVPVSDIPGRPTLLNELLHHTSGHPKMLLISGPGYIAALRRAAKMGERPELMILSWALAMS